jgi:O-antigen ligase
MIVFLLCLIIAILLFGSSKVLGVFGKILGLIVFTIGIGFLSNVTGLDGMDIFGIFLLLVAAGAGYFVIAHPEEWKAAQEARKKEK